MGKEFSSKSNIRIGYRCFSIIGGKALKSLLDWEFDEQLTDTREEISNYNITKEEILADNIERYKKAYFPPKVPELAMNVWNFIRQNDHHVIVGGGMQHFILGLDKEKLGTIADKYYNIDLGRFMFFINMYQNKLLERQHKLLNESKNKD